MKPNLFDYATWELTNDAIICWMLDIVYLLGGNVYENMVT